MPSDIEHNRAPGADPTFAPPSPFAQRPRAATPPERPSRPLVDPPRSTDRPAEPKPAGGPRPLATPTPPTQPSAEPITEPITEPDTFPIEPTAGPIDALLEADGSIVVVVDASGRVTSVNRAALEMLGAADADDLAPGSPAHGVLRSLLDHVPRRLLHDGQGGTWQGDLDHITPAGQPTVFRATVTVQPTADDDGRTVALIAHDVTAPRLETARLHHRATHDPLTGLANRRQALAILRDAVRAQRGHIGHVAALFIDLDRLKYVNDALGHEIGDRLLVSTAARLADSVRPDDHVARIGGDEFLVVCELIPDAVTALEVAQRIRRALTGRLRVRELDIEFSVSIGIALSDANLFDLDDADAASRLISNADTAMYEAKRSGRGRCAIFTSQMRSAARERTELAAALSHAITTGRLTVDYQPVFSAVDQRAVGAEALVRWQHPTRGRIDPALFISVAEESGSIGRLGDFVLHRALTDARAWHDRGLVPDDFAVHANVSQMQLASSAFVPQVLALLREHRVRPGRLVLEARETALLVSNVEVQRSVRALRRIGVQIAVDNFGTGANALSVLTDTGADILKLDGSLGLPSGSSDTDTRLVRAVVLLAHALDMRVIAERVSGAEQLRRLRAAGCDLVQGNLLGGAVPAERFDPDQSF